MTEDPGTSPAAPPPAVLELEVPAEPGALDAVQNGFAELLAQRPDLAGPGVIRFELALVEIVANIIEHAFDPEQPGRVLSARVVVTERHIEAELHDNGLPVPVDLAAATMPDEDAESGRGLAMALAALDHLSYERDGDRNRWLLRSEVTA